MLIKSLLLCLAATAGKNDAIESPAEARRKARIMERQGLEDYELTEADDLSARMKVTVSPHGADRELRGNWAMRREMAEFVPRLAGCEAYSEGSLVQQSRVDLRVPIRKGRPVKVGVERDRLADPGWMGCAKATILSWELPSARSGVVYLPLLVERFATHPDWVGGLAPHDPAALAQVIQGEKDVRHYQPLELPSDNLDDPGLPPGLSAQVRARVPELYKCAAKAKDITLAMDETIVVRFGLHNGKPANLEVLHDGSMDPEVLMCLDVATSRWSFTPGLDAEDVRARARLHRTDFAPEQQAQVLLDEDPAAVTAGGAHFGTSDHARLIRGDALQTIRGLEGCYDRVRRRSPGLAGRIEVRMAVDHGDVVGVKVVENTTGSRALSVCAAGQVAGWSYPRNVSIDPVVVPFTFQARL